MRQEIKPNLCLNMYVYDGFLNMSRSVSPRGKKKRGDINHPSFFSSIFGRKEIKFSCLKHYGISMALSLPL